MSPLLRHLERLDSRRAMAWATILEREFPGIGNQPGRVRGLAPLKPYLNPDPRPAVRAFVDGKAYVMVDRRPDLFPVVEDHTYGSRSGGELQVLTINSYKWRQYSVVPMSGGTTLAAFAAALREETDPTDGEPKTVATATVNTPPPALFATSDHVRVVPHDSEPRSVDETPTSVRAPFLRQGRLHVAVWAVTVLVLTGSLTSVPTGAPSNLAIALLLGTSLLGWIVIAVVALVAWARRRWQT